MVDIRGMSDEELLETILEGFEDDGRLVMKYIDIEVVDGAITISGRVSSDEELQLVDEVMAETLEIRDYHSKVWVDDTLADEGLDDDDAPDLKGLNFDDDDDLDDQEYDDDDDEDGKN